MVCVEILMYNVLLTHSCLYINIACNLIYIHQKLSKDKLLDRFLTEPKLQSLSNKVFEFEFSLSLCLTLTHALIHTQPKSNNNIFVSFPIFFAIPNNIHACMFNTQCSLYLY